MIFQNNQQNILWFSEIGKDNISQVGGKGANLGELLKAGITVPDGFCVTSSAYYNFLKQSKLVNLIEKDLSSLNPEDNKKLNHIAKLIQSRILSNTMDSSLEKQIGDAYEQLVSRYSNKYVAVRSSATAEDLPEASFAGQQATFLNISDRQQVVGAVKRCWASLFEARAIYYRAHNKFDHMKVGISVPIQLMIQSQVSGIMFTVDPVTGNKDVITIDAGLGLGESVVSGSITPDRYIVDKKSLSILEKEINKQEFKIVKVKNAGVEEDKHIKLTDEEKNTQKLADKHIVDLAKLGVKIENYYKVPQDTEWAVENDKIYFVQSRPVTTLKKNIKVSEFEGKKLGHATPNQPADEDVILKGASASVGMGSGPVNIIHSPSEIDKINQGDVLVTEMTTPDFVPAMKRAKAIITDTGGRTCHAAIVSRELGIPCVVGTGRATTDLKQGQVVTVDGAKGLVYKGRFSSNNNKIVPTTTRQRFMIRQEVPVTGTKLYVNLAEKSRASEIAKMPIDGVGLLRAEFMIAEMGEHPKVFVQQNRQKEWIDQLADGLRIFASSFDPRPVIYRATDFKSNEYKNLKGGKDFEPSEENPMIGYRGCLRYIKEPDVFNMELEAIKKVRDSGGFRNLHLMIPFVRTVDELKKVKEIVMKSGLFETRDFKFYMMAEVPSNVILIDRFLDVGVDGISIGSNDLTQLMLGVDRDAQGLADDFDERDDAVLSGIRHMIEKCRKRGISTSICGQAPSTYPEYTEFLIKSGITSISVNPDMIVSARRLVASVERKIMMQKMLE
jgi:pyruvate,water dikinase